MNSVNLRILLVDDDPLVIRVVKKLLSQKSFEVDTAHCAEKALELLKKTNYRAVVTDYEMPGETGVWLLERSREVAPETCRILHSGSDLTNVEAQIKSGVVQCFLSKPAPQIGSFLASLLIPAPNPSPRVRPKSEEFSKWMGQIGQA